MTVVTTRVARNELTGSLEDRVVLRVTFDTNAFDKVVRPGTYPKDTGHQDFVEIHEAAKRGELTSFLSDTIITLEGIGRDHRASVFGNTQIKKRTELVSEDTFQITLSAEASTRRSLHIKQAERFLAAFQLGFQLLMGAPRVGKLNVVDGPYVKETSAALPQRLDRSYRIARAIDDRGLGFTRVLEISRRWSTRAPGQAWYNVLGEAKDPAETREVARAVAEWSDAENIEPTTLTAMTCSARWTSASAKKSEVIQPSWTRSIDNGSPRSSEFNSLP